MTKEEFIRDFCCEIEILNQGNINLEIVTKARRRRDNKVVDSVKTNMDIHETNDWIQDTHTGYSITPWNWEKVIDHAKRVHLDYFAQRAPIDRYYPLNRKENPDISDMYC